eukprot:gene41342-54790_t
MACASAARGLGVRCSANVPRGLWPLLLDFAAQHTPRPRAACPLAHQAFNASFARQRSRRRPVSPAQRRQGGDPAEPGRGTAAEPGTPVAADRHGPGKNAGQPGSYPASFEATQLKPGRHPS